MKKLHNYWHKKLMINHEKISEKEFIEKYDEIIRSIQQSHGWHNYNVAKHGLSNDHRELYPVDMSYVISTIAINNEWLKRQYRSERINLFLKLKGVDIDEDK
jgi:hypothetical protein